MYGLLTTVGGAAPTVGQSVEARVGAVVCGRGVTQQVGNQISFGVKVTAAGPESLTCGGLGSLVSVTVGGTVVG